MPANDDKPDSVLREARFGNWFIQYHIWNGTVQTVENITSLPRKHKDFTPSSNLAWLLIDAIDSILKANESSLKQFLEEHDQQHGENV